MASRLLQNAIEYNHPGGEIELRLAETSGSARLTVRDTGLGIPEDTRSVVDEHGGDVDVESVPGRGTTFGVALAFAGSASRPVEPAPA